jgi:hypothetical protein
MQMSIRKHCLAICLSFFFTGILPTAAESQTPPTPAPTPVSGIAFIGRTESHGGANATVAVSPPANVQNGDFMLLTVASWNSLPSTPNGFSALGTPGVNSVSEYMSVFYKFYSGSDGLPYVVGSSNYPDVVLRAYRGVSGVDAWASAGSSSPATSLTLPALPATMGNGDEYLAYFATDQPISLPPDLGDATTQASQWQLGDGDKSIANAGTVPPAEGARSSSAGNWVGVAATLKSGAPPSPTPTPSSAVAFIGRTESHGGANATVPANPPAGVQNGDFMLLCVTSWNSLPGTPSGFTVLGTPVVNSASEYMSVFYKFYSISDGLPYIVASNYPDAVLRAYRGVTAVDAWGSAGSSRASILLALPALAATRANGDEYVGCFANDTQPITLPSDLGHATTQASQWQLADGDKAIGNAGTVPPAEFVTSSSAGNWIGVAATLESGVPSATPTPSSTPTPSAIPTPTSTATPASTASPKPSPAPTPTQAPPPSPTPTPRSAIAFIGRTENHGGANGSFAINPPAGVQNGDFMLLSVASWNSLPITPNGFTALGTPVVNSVFEYMSIFYKFYSTSDTLPYIVNSSGYPDAILRAYRGVSGIDALGSAGSGGPATSLTLPALPATSANGDEYVACFAGDQSTITPPSDLGHVTTQASQWQLGDGDKSIANAGTAPPAESARSSSAGNWIGVAATLESGAPPPPTPNSICTPVYTGTAQGNDPGFTTPQNIPAATTTQGCYQIAFVVTDNPGANYTGSPAGWTPVYAIGGDVQSEIMIHQNGVNEPASNFWTTAGTVGEVFELNISGVCNTSGYDGGIAAYSTLNASSMTVAAPPITSSGVNDLTLAFSNMPWNSIVTMRGASGITGFYTSVPSLGGYWYPGLPQNLAVNVSPTNPAYNGVGVSFQAAFAPGACVVGGGT